LERHRIKDGVNGAINHRIEDGLPMKKALCWRVGRIGLRLGGLLSSALALFAQTRLFAPDLPVARETPLGRGAGIHRIGLRASTVLADKLDGDQVNHPRIAADLDDTVSHFKPPEQDMVTWPSNGLVSEHLPQTLFTKQLVVER
jgi:hypothetical protein